MTTKYNVFVAETIENVKKRKTAKILEKKEEERLRLRLNKFDRLLGLISLISGGR